MKMTSIKISENYQRWRNSIDLIGLLISVQQWLHFCLVSFPWMQSSRLMDLLDLIVCEKIQVTCQHWLALCRTGKVPTQKIVLFYESCHSLRYTVMTHPDMSSSSVYTLLSSHHVITSAECFAEKQASDFLIWLWTKPVGRHMRGLHIGYI